jgi:anti-sigma-K factor RskA
LNIKEYISSGILEAYALGDLPAAEQAEVQANLVRYPELREELLRIEEAQEALLMAFPVSPPESAKAVILEKATSAPADSNVVQIHSTVKWWQFATAASLTVALVSGYAAFTYKQQRDSALGSLSILRAQNEQIAQDYNVVNQRLDQIEQAFQITNDPSYRRVIMKGTEGAPDALASVYWNESQGDVYLSIQHLRSLSKGQQFQLWAIADGKPVDAGVFDIATGLIRMKEIGKASAFAVTIEPTGGSINPSLSTMQVMGALQ